MINIQIWYINVPYKSKILTLNKAVINYTKVYISFTLNILKQKNLNT